jgi:hypothetical protein
MYQYDIVYTCHMYMKQVYTMPYIYIVSISGFNWSYVLYISDQPHGIIFPSILPNVLRSNCVNLLIFQLLCISLFFSILYVSPCSVPQAPYPMPHEVWCCNRCCSVLYMGILFPGHNWGWGAALYIRVHGQTIWGTPRNTLLTCSTKILLSP